MFLIQIYRQLHVLFGLFLENVYYQELKNKMAHIYNPKIKSQIYNIHGKDLMSGDNTADLNFFGDEQFSSGSSST